MYPLSPDYTPLTSANVATTVPLEKSAKSDFTLSTVAHVAWAITLGNITGRDDVLFLAMRNDRQSSLEAPSTMGPMVLQAPVRTQLRKDESLEDYQRSMQKELISMLRYERHGRVAALKKFGLQQLNQSSLSMHTRGEDPLVREMSFQDEEGTWVRVEPRRDLSTPIHGWTQVGCVRI